MEKLQVKRIVFRGIFIGVHRRITYILLELKKSQFVVSITRKFPGLKLLNIIINRQIDVIIANKPL